MKDHFPSICAMREGGWSVFITLEILQSQGEFITVDSNLFFLVISIPQCFWSPHFPIHSHHYPSDVSTDVDYYQIQSVKGG
jgi:hypothetical protein